jgi:hypothetical protein
MNASTSCMSVPGCVCPACQRLERALAKLLAQTRRGTLRNPATYAAVSRALASVDRAHTGTVAQ